MGVGLYGSRAMWEKGCIEGRAILEAKDATFTLIRNWPAIYVGMSPENGWPAKSLPNESEMRTTPRHKGAGIRNPT